MSHAIQSIGPVLLASPSNQRNGKQKLDFGDITGCTIQDPSASKPLTPLLQALSNKGYVVPKDCVIESTGRRIEDPRDWGRSGHEPERRREVLIETLLAQGTPSSRAEYHEIAQNNSKIWSRSAKKNTERKFPVICGDWGDTTLQLSRSHGRTFAVLNMANAYVAGGGYTEGMPAQEENMFRRTDCHFGVDEKEFDQQTDRYKPQITDLINAVNGEVLLDVKQPRVCIRGPENREKTDMGYAWLSREDIFEFYELRSAAVDLRGGLQFSIEECMKRINAQLDTLTRNGIRHAVLSAFGCGAFLNPPDTVSQCYCDALKAREQDFDCVAFAIFYPGYGDDNYTAFKQVFERNGMEITLPAAQPHGVMPMRAMVAQQSDGHPEVVLKNMPGPEGSVVAKVPNGQPLTFLADHGDYVRVRWEHTEGYARRANVVAAQVAAQELYTCPEVASFQFTDTNGDSITLSKAGHVVNVHSSSVGNIGIWEGFDAGHRIYKTEGRQGVVPEQSTVALLAFFQATPAQSFVAKQADGLAEVVLKSSPNSQGSVVAKVPNGQALVLLGDHGDYVKVCWEGQEAYARRANVVQEKTTKHES
jgi:putative heme iron utilization protein